MKTIRLTRNLGVGWPPYRVGETVDADDDVSDRLIEKGLAVLIKAVPNKPLQAVPENASIVAAEVKLKAISDQWKTGVDPADPPTPKQRKTKPKE